MKNKLETDVNQTNKFLFWIKRVIAGILLIWLVIYLLLWSLSPVLIRWQANKALEPMNLRLSDRTSIRLNPFILSLSLSDVELTSNHSSQVLAGIRTMVADIDVFELFDSVIKFEQMELSGVMLDVHRTADYTKIAGWQLNNQTLDAAPKQANEKKTQQLAEQLQNKPVSNGAENVNNWRVNADLINLQGINFNIDNLGHSHQIEIKQLQLNAVDLSDKEQRLSLQLKVLIDKAPIDLNADFYHRDGEGQLSIKFDLENLGLESFAYLADPTLLYMSGNVSSKIQAILKFDEQQVSVDLPRLALKFKQLAIGTSDFNILFADTNTLVSDSNFQVVGNRQPHMNVNFSMDNSQLDVKVIGTNNRLLGFDKFALSGGNVSWLGGSLPNISILNLNFEQLKFSQKDIEMLADASPKTSKLNQPLVRFGKVSAHELKFSEQHLSLNSLVLQELIANITLDKNKQLTGLILPVPRPSDNSGQPARGQLEENNKTDTASKDSKTKQPPSTTFTLDKLNVTGDSRLTFNDQSIQPNFSQLINLDKIEVISIDNRQSNNISRFIIKLKMDAYSGLNLEGKVQAFNEKLNLELQSSLNEFSLPAISPYLRNAMGFEMLSGQFDKKIKVTIVDNIIQGKADLNMRGMQLSTVDPEQGNTLKEQTAMPLNKALGLLMDDKGNLELSIPLSGDVSKPEFGVSDFVAIVTKKAIMSAAKSYLLDTFVPYANVLSVVMLAGEYMLKVSFEDLVYQPTITTIEGDQKIFVSQFINLLKDKTETQVKVCAFATPADLPEKTVELNEPLDLKQYQQQLLALALLRAEYFKAWVVEKGAIQSSRILLCKPRIDNSPKGKPRLEFEI